MGVLVARARLQAHKGIFKKRKATVWNSMLRRSSRPTLGLCGNSNGQVTPQKRRKQNERTIEHNLMHMRTGEFLFLETIAESETLRLKWLACMGAWRGC